MLCRIAGLINVQWFICSEVDIACRDDWWDRVHLLHADGSSGLHKSRRPSAYRSGPDHLGGINDICAVLLMPPHSETDSLIRDLILSTTLV